MLKKIRRFSFGALLLFLCAFGAPEYSRAAEFTISPSAPVEIVLPIDETGKTAFDWTLQDKLQWHTEAPGVRAAIYLREAIQLMTGRELPVSNKADLSRGIVLTTLALAPPAVRADAAVIAALRNTGEDSYNANEAFYIRSETDRILIVGNTPDGVVHGVVELLESVGYQVLGMGKNWIHAPNFHAKPLTFEIERSGRAGFYIRSQWVTSGQFYGVGTLMEVHDDADETVYNSYWRWRIGTHMAGQSMPEFPGHALYGYHKAIVDYMKETGNTHGFLTPKTTLGLDAERPTASVENNEQLWINTDSAGAPQTGKVWISDGKQWIEQNRNGMNVSLDHSVPFVREIILADLKTKIQAHAATDPDAPLIYGLDPEDGVHPIELTSDANWYPAYQKKESAPLGAPYILNGFKGLNQPRELWDGTAFSDVVFGFDNWLLREYDKWIDSLPAAERVTKSGRDKKELVRLSHYSYGFHDVPPNFNMDLRVRVMIAGFPKHRGWGKWKNFATQTDMAQAFQVMLPREPSGDYWINSIAYYADTDASSIRGSRLAPPIAQLIREEYASGFRAISSESDFNFGKLGLEYSLLAQMMWNPKQTDEELSAWRVHWLQKAFGSGWKEMEQYYDFLAPQNYKINAPNNWAKAIRFIQSADEKIVADSPEQKRLDDLKQFWYFYYLTETGQTAPPSPALKEFVWKGQMSYMTAMHMVSQRLFQTAKAADAAGPEFNTGRAHYTPEETQKWWSEILEKWKVTQVSDFADAKLSDGTAARAVDTNDLVAIAKFRGEGVPPDVPFLYNASSYRNTIPIAATTSQPNQEIGFQMFWPSNEGLHNRGRDVFYGISRWNEKQKTWDELIDKTTTSVASQTVTYKDGTKFELAIMHYQAAQPGTYRIEVLNGGDYSKLASLGFDFQTQEYSRVVVQTYLGNIEGLTQSPTFFYIPRGTKSLDLEIWDPHGGKTLTFYNGLPADGAQATRKVDVSKRGTHTIPLNAGEDGTIAMYSSNGFAFPYLYSAPNLWAKSTAALLVPRAIAKADALAITE